MHGASAGVHVIGEHAGNHLARLLPWVAVAAFVGGADCQRSPSSAAESTAVCIWRWASRAKPMSITSAASPIRPKNIITNNTRT